MIRFSLDQHRHLLGPRKDVFASPYGLLGGGWSLNDDVDRWMRDTGLRATVVEIMSLDSAETPDGFITFDQYRTAIPVMDFENEDDAFMFKMRWL